MGAAPAVRVWRPSGTARWRSEQACSGQPEGCAVHVSRALGSLLTRPTPATLARYHHAIDQDFAAPYAPGLPPTQRAVEALGHQWAGLAHGLGLFDVVALLGEPEVKRIAYLAGKLDIGSRKGGPEGRER